MISKNIEIYYLPDKETTSLRSSPTSVNFETIEFNGSNGEGSPKFARDPFETVPSLRPSKTLHEGPPVCQTSYKGSYSFFWKLYKFHISTTYIFKSRTVTKYI